MIEARNLCKCFGPLEVLADVSFNLARGQVLAIVGPSGSGKSTLLRCLNRFVLVDSGTISLLEGRVVISGQAKVDERLLRQNVGMVFQQFNLWPHRTVLDNIIEAPMRALNMKRSEAFDRAR